MKADAPTLVERAKELAEVDVLVERTLLGIGGTLVVEGPAGIGKTSLLYEVRRRAKQRGFQVLPARGGELHRHSGFGLVRQLFAATVAQGADRGPLLAGVAGLAAPALGLDRDDAPELPTPASEPDVHHGLYWVCSNLADCGPLVIAVDDAHWADPPSLRWIAYLAHRLEDLPLLLVVGIRTSEHSEALSVLADVRADPNTVVLRPQPLSPPAVADVVRRHWGKEPEQAFVAACSEATGGNPFLLRVLLKAAIDGGVLATAHDVGRLEGIVPTEFSDAILARIEKLPSRPCEFARSAAVLGDGGELRHAAVLSGLDEGEAATAADDLVAADLLRPGPPLRFTHALVRRAVYAALPVFQRRMAHRRAALLLQTEGQPPEAVAAHLLEGEPMGDGWAVDVLRRAAATAAAAAAPDTAIAYLRRALTEPPPQEVRSELLAELGILEATVGDPQAVEHLTLALEGTSDGATRARLADCMCGVVAMDGRFTDAFDLLRDTLDTAVDLEREERLLLEGDLLMVGLMVEPGRRLIAERRARLSAEAAGGATPGERRVLAFLTQESLYANRPAVQVAQLARHALGGGRLLAESTADLASYYQVVDALTMAGDLDVAAAALDDALRDARSRGSTAGLCHATLSRCGLYRELGAIRDLQAEARAGLDASRVLRWSLYEPIFGFFLAEALMERGELEAAKELLEDLPCDSPAALFALAARGRLQLEMGRAEQALENFLACGRHQLAIGHHCPAILPWRSPAALALARMGDLEEGARLAAEELASAEAFGTARSIGVALRAVAAVEPHGEKKIQLLRRAENVLEPSPASLELARTRLDLGAALRRVNMRMESRTPLRLALDAAYRCGATGLAQQCWSELSATGARPPRAPRTRLDTLTPSELRVAKLATEGLTIREMAQALFVSRKTVEKHLGQVYSKLGVHSREELRRRTEDPLRVASHVQDVSAGRVWSDKNQAESNVP